MAEIEISVAMRRIAGARRGFAPGIEDAIQGHPADESLEAHSLNELAEPGLAAVEEHLLVCGHCRARLEQIEPVKFIHYTNDGPIYSRATRLTTGQVMAQHWGRNLHGGRVFGSVSAARKYLCDSFSQMFPEHTCTVWCAPSNGVATGSLGARMLRARAKTKQPCGLAARAGNEY